jgi:hypothetical protein
MEKLAETIVNKIGKDASGLNTEIFAVKKYLTGIKSELK